MKEKNKTVAALLAIFTGWVGVHRFYLGQTGLGIFYIFLMFTGISFLLSFIDFIVFMTMDEDVFDIKYNKHLSRDFRRYDTDFDRQDRPENRRQRYEDRMRERERKRSERIAQSRQGKRATRPPRPAAKKSNPFKVSGIEKYKDYDYEGAIEDFNKALSIDSRDVAVHFNLACSYSLIEEKDKAFYHLSKAVEYGFLDFEKIKTHDALAYLRIQDEFDTFAQNNYRLDSPDAGPSDKAVATNVDLLEQLRQLGELREKGLLTEDEFQIQKKRLLDN